MFFLKNVCQLSVFLYIIFNTESLAQCLLGSGCAGFGPPCDLSCNDVINVDDLNTIQCSASSLDTGSDIRGCCTPSLRGRLVNGGIPPSCGAPTLPNGEAPGYICIYILRLNWE